MEAQSPDPRTTRITFSAESVRAISVGIQETAVSTFAILIAVSHFELGELSKATLLASFAFGLLGGLFAVPLIAKIGWRVSRAAAAIQLVSMAGFLVAACSNSSGLLYLIGMCTGMGVIGIAIPLQTHYMKENFPASKRGRLFGVSIVIRASTAMLFSWLLGNYLDDDINRFSHILFLYAAASGLSAICQFIIPSKPFDESIKKPVLGQSIGWLTEDRVFGRTIAAAMAMGIGVLSANALRVDYLVNPKHALVLEPSTVALITGTIPHFARLLSAFFWGWLFDHIDFFKLRAIVNLIFFAGILLYFLPGEVTLIGIGSALFGLARGGGEILWNLWVTKLDRPDRIAGYMSVHTFMTGLRVAFTPFVGFYLVKLMGISTMVAFSISFVILSFVILWPLVFPTGLSSKRE